MASGGVKLNNGYCPFETTAGSESHVCKPTPTVVFDWRTKTSTPSGAGAPSKVAVPLSSIGSGGKLVPLPDAGQPDAISRGTPASITSTENVTTASFSDGSVARHVTREIPIGNGDPDAGLQLAVIGPPAASTPLGEGKCTVAVVAPNAVVVTTAFGTVRTGGKVSRTVTVNSPTSVWIPSVAVHVTFVLPMGNRPPEAGLHRVVSSPVPPCTRGWANEKLAPPEDETSSVASPGTRISMLGGVGVRVGSGVGVGVGSGVEVGVGTSISATALSRGAWDAMVAESSAS